jgi:hypothetical protein
MTIPGPSYANTKSLSRVDRWLQLTARPHSVRGESRYRGVSRAYNSPEKPWRTCLRYQGRSYYGGQFATEEEAALAWNQLALRFIGPGAEPRLNKITSKSPATSSEP